MPLGIVDPDDTERMNAMDDRDLRSDTDFDRTHDADIDENTDEHGGEAIGGDAGQVVNFVAIVLQVVQLFWLLGFEEPGLLGRKLLVVVGLLPHAGERTVHTDFPRCPTSLTPATPP